MHAATLSARKTLSLVLTRAYVWFPNNLSACPVHTCSSNTSRVHHALRTFYKHASFDRRPPVLPKPEYISAPLRQCCEETCVDGPGFTCGCCGGFDCQDPSVGKRIVLRLEPDLAGCRLLGASAAVGGIKRETIPLHKLVLATRPPRTLLSWGLKNTASFVAIVIHTYLFPVYICVPNAAPTSLLWPDCDFAGNSVDNLSNGFCDTGLNTAACGFDEGTAVIGHICRTSCTYERRRMIRDNHC